MSRHVSEPIAHASRPDSAISNHSRGSSSDFGIKPHPSLLGYGISFGTNDEPREWFEITESGRAACIGSDTCSSFVSNSVSRWVEKSQNVYVYSNWGEFQTYRPYERWSTWSVISFSYNGRDIQIHYINSGKNPYDDVRVVQFPVGLNELEPLKAWVKNEVIRNLV
jgi:hypothetical protein